MLRKVETQETPGARVARGIFERGLVKFGSFTLSSGLQSPFYIDLRELVGVPSLLADVARVLEVEGQRHFPQIDRIAAVPYGAFPIAVALSLQTGIPMVYLRKEAKTHGTQKILEGPYNPEDRVLIIEDLFTTGSSAINAIRTLEEHGLEVAGALALVDRRPKWVEFSRPLWSAYSLAGLLKTWQEMGLISEEQLLAVRDFEESMA